ncbi:hypothetical protein ACQF5H_27700, partial [Klebsiella pneumoniae]
HYFRGMQEPVEASQTPPGWCAFVKSKAPCCGAVPHFGCMNTFDTKLPHFKSIWFRLIFSMYQSHTIW